MSELSKNQKRIKTVWRFGRKYIPLFILAEICILISYATSIVLPLNLTKLVDKVLYGRQINILWEVITAYAILFLVSTIFNLIYAYTWQTLNNKYVVDVKNKLFEKTIFAKVKFLSSMNSGDIMSRIDGDADQFIHIIQRNLFHFINSILLCIGILIMVARINMSITLILLIAAVLPIVITRISGKLTEKYSKASRETNGEFSGKLFEILKGMREVKIFCAEKWATSLLFSKLKRIIKLNNRLSKVGFVLNKAIYLVNLMTSLIIYGFSALLIINGHFSVGLFLAVIEYIALMHKKMNWMLRIYLDWNARKISVDRVNEILESESENDNGGLVIGALNNIEFKNVSFGYEGNTVLKNASFKIKQGERVGIVGTSGAGKTTITGLIMKMLEPQTGNIYINGQDIEAIKYSDIRKKIGIVQQDILLFNDSVRYNLLLGNQDISDNELMYACEQVGLSEFVKQLPQGLDTRIGLNTQGLSGGQKQRLMIARILLKRASTIIFDEATSALDIETESMVAKELVALNDDTTMIIISHRLDTIKSCNKIIVINDGQVESIGRHEDLVNSSKAYHTLFCKGEAVA